MASEALSADLGCVSEMNWLLYTGVLSRVVLRTVLLRVDEMTSVPSRAVVAD